MSEQVLYIGYIEHHYHNNVIITISLSEYPEVFTGEYYPITADSGEGSLVNLFIKLMRGKPDVK